MSKYAPGPWGSKHTPGPWGYHATFAGHAIVAGGGSIRVAEAIVRDVGHEDERANVHLIAAAPDLLWACEALLSGSAKAPLLARAAIAKAKGETT